MKSLLAAIAIGTSVTGCNLPNTTKPSDSPVSSNTRPIIPNRSADLPISNAQLVIDQVMREVGRIGDDCATMVGHINVVADNVGIAQKYFPGNGKAHYVLKDGSAFNLFATPLTKPNSYSLTVELSADINGVVESVQFLCDSALSDSPSNAKD